MNAENYAEEAACNSNLNSYLIVFLILLTTISNCGRIVRDDRIEGKLNTCVEYGKSTTNSKTN